MEIIDAGHRYELESYEGAPKQLLQFIKKRPAEPHENCDPGGLVTVHDGTTNEEVIKMLLNRMGHLQQLHACRENAIVITKLEECLMWLEKRTADRRFRGVEELINHKQTAGRAFPACL